MKQSGAEILIECLLKEGVDTVFGYPGGQILPVYDALYDCKLRHILTRHEQGAAHAADGYARATGKTGVCIATSGPGATNLVTGIATAYMDSVPMVAITGQVPTSMIGRDSFQEADITGITLPITKHNFLVTDVKDLPKIIREAFHIASTGRQGPVLIDLPKDVQNARSALHWPEGIDIPSYKPTYSGHPKQIMEAAKSLVNAKQPVLYIGGGVAASGASDEVLRLAELLSIPVATTLMGTGAFPSDHPLCLGMLGMHGTPAANYAVTESDLLVAIGARFDDRVTGNVATFATGSKIIHIDIDPAEIGKNVKVNIPIVGDVKNILAALMEAITKVESFGNRDISKWSFKVREWHNSHPATYNVDGDLKPQFVIEELYRATEGKAIITTEVGQHQMWAAQFYKFRSPRSFISSGGLGTMGYGFPAAIGAQLGRPGETVIDIAGDGSIQMNIQELATLAAYGIPVKIAIINNGYLGMVRQWQEIFFEHRYSHVELSGNPDFVKLAEAYGIKGLRATDSDSARDVIAEALKHDGPVVMDFRVAQEENALPMVPPNGAINNMVWGRKQ